MKRIEAGLVVLLAVLFVGCQGANEPSSTTEEAPPPAAAETSEVTLFDGSSIDGWTKTGDANWHIVEDYVEANSGNGHLVSPMPYTNFKLTAEFWVDADANSGIFIRCANPTDIGADKCYEVNIFDKRPDPKYRTGAIVNVAEPAVKIDAGGKWNKYEITAEGSHLVVKLNDMVTVDTMDSQFPAGHFTLQYGAGIARFKNIKITPL
jgi:hypothetical protein